MIKTKVAFLEGRLYPANWSNLKSIQKAVIWQKKSCFGFDHVNRLLSTLFKNAEINHVMMAC